MEKENKLRYVPGHFGYLVGFTRILQFFWFMTLSLPDLLLTFVRKFFPKRGKNIAGKNVLITGAANGLGRALAFEFAKKGSKIICVDINEAANEKTVEEINKKTGTSNTAKSYICDVGDEEKIKELAEKVLEEYKHVDILVNNAGLIYGKPILNEEQSMVKKVLNVNQMSSYWMVRNFLPSMKERNDGHLVFINSIASLTPLGDAAMYTVTKYALLGLSAALADEFSRDPNCSNIKISSVHPFFMGTEGLKAQAVSSRLLMMRVEEAAQQIVSGIRRDYFNFTVPGFETGFFFLSLSRIIPLKVYNKLAQQVYNQILLPEKKKKWTQQRELQWEGEQKMYKTLEEKNRSPAAKRERHQERARHLKKKRAQRMKNEACIYADGTTAREKVEEVSLEAGHPLYLQKKVKKHRAG